MRLRSRIYQLQWSLLAMSSWSLLELSLKQMYIRLRPKRSLLWSCKLLRVRFRLRPGVKPVPRMPSKLLHKQRILRDLPGKLSLQLQNPQLRVRIWLLYQPARHLHSEMRNQLGL